MPVALVTGCAGFIGSQLTESLLEDGWTVRGVDAFTGNYARALKEANLVRARAFDEFSLVTGDVAEIATSPLLEGADAVFHLAAAPGVRPSWGRRFDAYLHANVLALQRLLHAVARCETPPPVVLASSSSVYGDAPALPTREDTLPAPVSPYGVTKAAGEQLCGAYAASHGLRIAVLRYFSVYGPRQRPDMAFTAFCRAALDGRPLEVYGSGAQTRDFTYVGDVVAATRAAAGSRGTYNVGGGSRSSLDEAIAILEDLAGRPLDVIRTPARAGDVRDTGADITRARSELGWAPTVGLADGLVAQWEWAAAVREGARG